MTSAKVFNPNPDAIVAYDPATMGVARVAVSNADRVARYAAAGHLDTPLTEAELKALQTVQQAVAAAAPPAVLSNEMHSITRLNIGNTYHCNMGCSYCYNELDLKDRKGSEVPTGMSFETARAMVDALVAQSDGRHKLSLVFIGGEPLLEFKVLSQTVQYAQQRAAEADRKLDLVVYTNGTLLNWRALDWAQENSVSYVISLDGPPVLNRRRTYLSGAPTTKVVLRNIRRMIEHGSQPLLRVRAVASPDANLLNLHRYLFDLGFNEIHVQPMYNEEGIDSIAAEDSRALLDWYRELLFSGTVVSVLPFEGFIERLAWHGNAVASWYPCSAGRTALGVGPDGGVYPCHHFLEESKFKLGDVRQGLPVLNQRREFFHRVDEREPCRSCWARHACGGECYHRAHAAGAGYAGVLSPVCQARKSLIGLTIDLFAELALDRPDVLRRVVLKDYSTPEPHWPAYDYQDLSPYAS
jgi:uncharacterized protein